MRISHVTRLGFLASVVLGNLGGILGRYYLTLLSVLLLFLTLSFSSSLKHRQMIFLFPLLFLSTLALNIRCSLFSAVFGYSLFLTLYSLITFLMIFVTIISIEEIVAGIIGLLLWGEQSLLCSRHPLHSMRK